MDNKIKWSIAFCTLVLTVGLYVDNKPAQPIDFEKPETLSHSNMLKHANNNVAAAQYVLGTYYGSGRPQDQVAPDQEKAKAWFKKAADNEHATAAFEYARLIAKNNPAEAEKYYRQSMAKGYTAAVFALAQLKFRSSTPADLKEGIQLMYAASTLQDPMALAYLATLQHEGAGVKKDRVSAVLSIQKAAELAPNLTLKKDWTDKYTVWFAELNSKEQKLLNEQLMLGSGKTTTPLLGPRELTSAELSSLLSNTPINKTLPSGK